MHFILQQFSLAFKYFNKWNVGVPFVLFLRSSQMSEGHCFQSESGPTVTRKFSAKQTLLRGMSTCLEPLKRPLGFCHRKSLWPLKVCVTLGSLGNKRRG